MAAKPTYEELEEIVKELKKEASIRRRVQEALQKTEEKYRLLFENAGSAITYFDAEGKCVLVNRRVIDGLGGRDITGNSIYDIFPKEVADFHIQRFTKIMKEGKGGRFEDAFELPAGRRWFSSDIQPVKDESGNITGVQVLSDDITERRQTEEALRLQSEVAENMAEGACLIRTSDSMIVYANKRFERMFGYDPGELVNKHVSIVNAPSEKNPEAIANEIIQSLKEKGTWMFDIHNIKKDGTLFWCHANVSTFEHRDFGEVWVAVHEDITEQKLAQEALRESQEKYCDIFQNVSDFLYFHDLEGNLIETNLAWKTEYGFSKDDLANSNVRDLIPERYKPQFEDYLKRVKEHGRDEGILSVMTKDGREHIVEYRNSLVYGSTGPIGVRGSARDITEAKRAEAQLKRYSGNLEKMVEERTAELKKALHDLQNTQSQLLQSEKMASIGQLAAGVAHEINNPVGFVKSNLGTLNEYREDLMRLLDHYRILGTTLGKEKDIRGDGALRKALENIKKIEDEIGLSFILGDYKNVVNESLEGMARVSKIVSDLKDFSHVDKAELEHADLNKGIESTLNIVWNELKYKAQVIKDLGKIPLVKCYPQRINQVFMNILVNAAQAIDGKGKIRITTRADTDNGYVEITINDTGKGIPPDVLPKIFDPFFTTKEVGKGTGLGLNMAYNIIQRHKGTIDVESEVGKGTTFIIRIPVETDA